ncbi:MAG: hypothetical protein RL671_799 [Pseudomonadota bacterium]|jgi:hypothetical protein
MNAHHPPFATPIVPPAGVLPGSGRADFGQASANAMSMKWAALNDAAGVVAMLAGITVEPLKPELRHFPATMRDAGGWRRTMAEQGIDDLAAVMEPGIAALLSVHARGINPKIPAQALWQEYLAARNGLMALVPPPGEALAPRRFT